MSTVQGRSSALSSWASGVLGENSVQLAYFRANETQRGKAPCWTRHAHGARINPLCSAVGVLSFLSDRGMTRNCHLTGRKGGVGKDNELCSVSPSEVSSLLPN